MRTAHLPAMQKLALLLLPLALAACVERDTVPANSAGTPTSSSSATSVVPDTAPPPPSSGTGGTSAHIPGRGEGELESPATTPTEQATEDEVLPDGSIDGAGGSGGVQQSSEVERNTASGNEIEMEFDPALDPAVIDESGATGFGGSVMSPDTLGDGELRPDDNNDNEIGPDEVPMMPADVVDAGPAMIP